VYTPLAVVPAHGIRVPNPKRLTISLGYFHLRVEDEGNRGWVAPYGFNEKKRLSSGLHMDKLNDLAEEVSASQQLWVFDCCHAGNVLKGTRGGGNARFALNKSRRSAVQAAVTRSIGGRIKRARVVF